MPEETPPNRPPRDDGEAPDNVTYLDQVLWRRLGEAKSATDLCQSWLELQSRLIGGVAGGLVVLRGPDGGAFVPTAMLPRGSREGERLKTVVERAVKESQGVVIRGGAEDDDELRYQLAFPVRVENEVHGAAALEIASRPQAQLQSAMRQLQWGIPWLQSWILRQEKRPQAPEAERLSEALELTAVALEEPTFRGAATAFVTELATRLDCDRVSVGFVQGRQVKVRAVSHSAEFGKQMNLIRAIGMAMEEAVDQQALLVYPDRGGDSHDVVKLHGQLARGHGDDAVLTVPFGDKEGRPVGAMTLERSAPVPFDAATVELCDAVGALVGPILEGKRQADRLLIAKIGSSFWLQVKRLFGPRYTGRKLIVTALVALVVFFSLATGQYRVKGETVLEGEVRRVVVAPYRGYIFEAPVRAGDVVGEGDPLCNLDERDLRLEYSKWSSEREQYMFEHRQAMADRDAALAGILTKKMRQAEAELALLSEQLERARITAPFDGVVVSGDLTQSLGAPVEAGDVLFEITPLDAYRVTLQIDERDIGQVRVGQTGELVLTALPETKLPFTITRITPVSRSEEGKNTFAVEAMLDEATARMRPGMEGFGKIEIDRRKLVWIWTHPLIEWIRLWAWTWLP